MPSAIQGAFSSWRTTTGGIGAIAGGIAAIANALSSESGPDLESIMTGFGMIAAGISLLFARDNSITSEKAGAK